MAGTGYELFFASNTKQAERQKRPSFSLGILWENVKAKVAFFLGWHAY
jgi:hypothetical protein